METAITVQNFKGWRNDGDAKQVPPDYQYRVTNFDFDKSNNKLETILMPERVKYITGQPIDGMAEFRYLDKNNVLHNAQIIVSGGIIFRCKDIEHYPIEKLKSGLETGTCTFAIHNDMLYIANGKNYPQMYNGQSVTEMGAPFASIYTNAGNLQGDYQYQVTYLFQTGVDPNDGTPIYGIEEVLGSKSNVITTNNQTVLVDIPIGYSGVAARRIYRNTQANPDAFRLLATITDNTTMTYTDNIVDGGLETAIPAINNELPRPKFLQVANQILFAVGDDTLPTQMFATDTDLTIFDRASFIDVSNFGNDNTPLNGIGYDYNQIVVGTGRNIIFVNPNPNIAEDGSLSFSVTYTRANVGILDGHSLQRVSAFGNFPGGLMFVSTERDVRLVVGNQAITLTTLDNISTNNYSQAIVGSLPDILSNYDTLCSAFYDHRYILCVNGNKYVFNTRNQGWVEHDIDNGNVRSNPVYLAVLNGKLYNGQPDGWIEREYSSVDYLGEEIPAYIESPQMFVDTKYKMITTMKMWFSGSTDNNIDVKVYLDDNQRPIEADFSVKQGAYDANFYSDNFYDVDSPLDYKNFNINYNARWVRYTLEAKGMCSFQGFSIFAET